jgi:hypothetical protein
MRLLHRLRPTPYRVEIHELAMVARLLLGPERFDRLDPLAQQLPSRLEGRPVIFHLHGVPAAADAAESETPGELIKISPTRKSGISISSGDFFGGFTPLVSGAVRRSWGAAKLGCGVFGPSDVTTVRVGRLALMPRGKKSCGPAALDQFEARLGSADYQPLTVLGEHHAIVRDDYGGSSLSPRVSKSAGS